MLTPRFKIAYPGRNEDPWYDLFQSMVLDTDQLLFSEFEDRNLFIYTDGAVSWNLVGADYIVSFVQNVIFHTPTFGRDETLPGPASIIIPENHYLMFDLSRGPTNNVDLSSLFSVVTQLPISGNSCALCWHAPNHKLYFRTGLVLSTGDTVIGLAPSGGGSGATNFLALSDTPSVYTGAALQVVRVNAGETGLEFATVSGTGSYKTIEIPFDSGAASFSSTTVIPAGARVLACKCRIDAPFQPTDSVLVRLVGVSTEDLLEATEIQQDTVGLYEGALYVDVDATTTGPVYVYFTGAPIGGGGKAIIIYDESPNS